MPYSKAFSTPLVLIMGPTGIGKTQLAIACVQRFPLEIISVDSAMVYKGLDIGTAKPSLAELSLAPHHLIDVCDPSESYSVEHFCQQASELIHEITKKGKIPCLVGGTFLYFKALLRGLAELPSANPELRDQIMIRATQLGWPALHHELQSVDPVTAQRVHPNDQQRIQRALEVFQLTGKPLSDWLAASQNTQLGDSVVNQRFNVLALGLWPGNRSQLHQRLEARLSLMMASGFVDEVAALKQNPALHADLPAMRSVGYRQIWQYLDGLHDQAEAQYRALVATRQLAKRQMTWQRQWPDLTSFKTDDTLMKTSVFSRLEAFIAS